jgi:hypothetical protein
MKPKLTSKASQQAALKGWNPAMAAAYVNQATAGAYDANQQANQNQVRSERRNALYHVLKEHLG